MTDDILKQLPVELAFIEKHGTGALNDLDHAALLVALGNEIKRLRELCRTYFDNEHELLNEIERLNKIINDAPPKGFVVRETSNSTYTVITTEF